MINMSNKILKKILFKIILFCHSSRIRKFIYQKFFNYSIGVNVKIDKCIINCKKVTIGDHVILRDHNLISCNDLEVGDETEINSNNTILGNNNFKIGSNSRIMNYHYFDVWNNITIGNNTWIAGRNSQFWTHGSTKTKLKKHLSITIGNNVYIGSNCCISPGIVISDLNLVGMGSIVLNSIESNKNIVSGNPAKIIKNNIDWRVNW